MSELREIVARAIVDEISSHNFVLDNSNLAHVMMDGGFDFQRTADAALSALRAEGALVEWEPISTLKFDDYHHFLVRAPSLYHADFNPDGVSLGTLPSDDPADGICTMYWNGSHDCYIEKIIHDATHWRPIEQHFNNIRCATFDNGGMSEADAEKVEAIVNSYRATNTQEGK